MYRDQLKAITSTLAIGLFALMCGGGGGGAGSGAPTDPGFPSAASTALSPEGNDAFSSTTNMSRRAEDPETKASGLAGAAFIKPPEPNNYGAVSLAYNIEVPAGRAGMQPGLSLGYSSSGGDGWAGIGWNVGLGSIARSTDYGQLYYDQRDVFTYNGKRLVKVSGPSNSENGVYRLEIEGDFARLELSDAESGGVWTVRDAGGTEHVYGESKANRIYDPADENATYSWYLARSTDRNGNYLEVEYDDSDYDTHHILYLKEIRYAGNAGAGLTPQQYVRFETKKRDDSYVSKAAGFVMKMDRLLDRIEVGYDGSQLWDYQLVYETSADSNRPLLKTVNSSRTTTQPEFRYGETTHLFAWQNVTNPNYGDLEVNPEETRYFEGDFNGDGISDLVFFNPETGYWKAAEAMRGGGYANKTYGYRYKGFNSAEKIQFFKGNVTGDYNGDGRADIAFYLPETRDFIVAEHDGRVFQFRNYGRFAVPDLDIFMAEWFPGDYDGDGLSDTVLFDEPSGDWWLMRNRGGSFTFVKFAHHFQHLFRGDYTAGIDQGSAATVDGSRYGDDRTKIHWLNGDYNGDGRTDISFYDERSGRWWVGANYRKDASPGFELRWTLYKQFTAPEQTLFGFDRFSGDFNGDGFSDFLLFDKDKGEWILGETQDGTIAFRVFSRTPQYKTITRWLQGDFNGDGRTDIGFYSATDNNFWIGEATPNGFRYRIYNNLDNGPDAARVMATPAPLDEVKIERGRRNYPVGSQTVLLEYAYDGNQNEDRGETVYAGCYTGNDCVNQPELLIYDRKLDRLSFKKGTGAPSFVMDTDLDGDGRQVLGDAPRRNASSGQDELLVYRKDVGGNDTHGFYAIRWNGAAFVETLLAEVEPGDVDNFSYTESLWLLEHWGGAADRSLLVLDDQASTARYVHVVGDTATPIAISGSPLNFKDLFRAGASGSNRNKRNQYSFFVARLDANVGNQVLAVDRSSGSHRWYIGTLDLIGNQIGFNQPAGSATLDLLTNEYDGTKSQAGLDYYVRDEGLTDSIVYGKLKNGVQLYHRIRLTTALDQITYNAGAGVTHAGAYDHDYNPLINTAAGLKKYDISASRVLNLSASTHVSREVERPDLYTKVYPFRWIQGDYNGDGKTDIGIFHLKEPTWYFANTTGTVPDLIETVYNGIGGSYTLEFENSTRFDNTGADDIPDLPINYKVCTKITQDDGQGQRITLNYEYKDGHAFSAYIDGRKEVDYFGFGQFTMIDGYGGRTIRTYNNRAYSNYLLNRALAGAIKESRYLGYDNNEYSRKNYEYQIHTITQGGSQVDPSYMVTPAVERSYVRGTLVETKNLNIALSGYSLDARTESMTDHFSDAAHASETLATLTEYETDAASNQQRPTLKRTLTGSYLETTAAYNYDGSGNLIRTTVTATGANVHSADPQVVEYDYDGAGNKIEERDVSGAPARVTRYDYDGALETFVTETRQITGGTDLVTTSQINYDSAFGQPERVTDPNGNDSYSDYDGYGRLIASRADVGGSTETLETYSYSTAFPLSARTDYFTGTSDPGLSSRVYTDGLGRDIHSVRTADAGRIVRTGRILYDAIGRVIQKGQADYAGADELDAYRPQVALRNPTITTYDSSGRVKTITLPKAASEDRQAIITTTYNDPYEVTTTHSAGTSKTTIKNGRGHVLYVTDAGTGDNGQAVTATIGFCYDPAGNRTQKSDLNGATLACDNPNSAIPAQDLGGNNLAYWRYDSLGRAVAQSDPDLGVTTNDYNEFGDVVSTTDALSRTTTMSYDRLGRMTQKVLPASEGTVYYEYDANPESSNALGRLTAVHDPASSIVLSYDELGRKTREKRIINDHTHTDTDVPYVATIDYDLLSRTKEINYPENPRTGQASRACYTYNSFGYVASIATRLDGGAGTGCDASIVNTTAYNEFGQMTQMVYGNDTTSNYQYDVKGRLEYIQTVTDTGGTPTTILDAKYTFNAQDSIKRVENTGDVFQTDYQYAYDGINRLVTATGSYVETDDGTGTAQTTPLEYKRGYVYTQNGNLDQKHFYNTTTDTISETWDYTYVNHQARVIDSTVDGTRFQMSYDAVGNMIHQNDLKNGKEKQIAFNSYNRIREVVDPNVGAGQVIGQYWYDDRGFRIRKKAKHDKGGDFKDVEVIYPSMYFGMEYIQEDDALNSVANIYHNGLRIAAMAQNGAKVWYMTDQVDSVKFVVDGNADVVTRTEYMPYGETFVQKGDEDHAPKYNSQELDRETNYYFYNARYYDPEIARFTSADTVIDGEFDTQGWNRFMYVKGNPIGAKDPTGHQEVALGDAAMTNSIMERVLIANYRTLVSLTPAGPIISYMELIDGRDMATNQRLTTEDKVLRSVEVGAAVATLGTSSMVAGGTSSMAAAGGKSILRTFSDDIARYSKSFFNKIGDSARSAEYAIKSTRIANKVVRGPEHAIGWIARQAEDAYDAFATPWFNSMKPSIGGVTGYILSNLSSGNPFPYRISAGGQNTPQVTGLPGATTASPTGSFSSGSSVAPKVNIEPKPFTGLGILPRGGSLFE